MMTKVGTSSNLELLKLLRRFAAVTTPNAQVSEKPLESVANQPITIQQCIARTKEDWRPHLEGIGQTLHIVKGNDAYEPNRTLQTAKALSTITRDDGGTPTNLTVDRGSYILKTGFLESENFTVYVNANAKGFNNGSSWSNAYTNLQTAIANTQAGDEIWVAAGSYKPTNESDRNSTFNLKNNVAIYGGFIGNETSREQRNWDRNLTTLSGDIGVSGSTLDNSYHVVSIDQTISNSILDGFVVTGGKSNDFSGVGGGIYEQGGSPTLRNLTIANNSALTGGGMYVNSVGALSAAGGGTVSNPTLTNVKFLNNTASIGGGLFVTNSFIFGNPGTTTVVNSLFAGNSANATGFAGGFAGGIGNSYYNSVVLTNVTLTENTATNYGGGLYAAGSMKIINGIVWGNESSQNAQIHNAGDVAVSYSLIQGGYSGIGNLNVDPLFLNAAEDNYRIATTSPALNAGNNSSIGEATDLDGKSRLVGAVDLGAYEHPKANIAPDAINDIATVDRNLFRTIAVLANDINPDDDRVLLLDSFNATSPQGGAITLDNQGTPWTKTDDRLIYTPKFGYVGADSFNYTVGDGYRTDATTVNLIVVNTSPAAINDTGTALKNHALTINVLGNDTDFNNDPLQLQSFDITSAKGGAVARYDNGTPSDLTDDSLVYTPKPGFDGIDTFTYTMSDGLTTDAATATIAVTNTAPNAVNDNITIQCNKTVPVPVLGNDIDADSDLLKVSSFNATSAQGGAITLDENGTPTDSTDDRLIYTPKENFSGIDAFAYTVSDGTDTTTATVTVKVNVMLLNQSHRPGLNTIHENTANPTGSTIAQIVPDGSITDIDHSFVGEAIAVVSIDNANGKWQYSLNNGNTWLDFGNLSNSQARLLDASNRIRFIPNSNFKGAASFTFKAWDKTSGLVGEVKETGFNGSTTVFSADSDTANISVISADPTQLTVTTFEDVIDSNDGLISLREAIIANNDGLGNKTIHLGEGIYTLSLGGTGSAEIGDFDISKNLTITGLGAGKTTIDGNDFDRLFTVLPNSFLNLSGLTIANGHTSSNGGAIFNQGTVNLVQTTLTNNSANLGGAIFNEKLGVVAISNSVFLNNGAYGANGTNGSNGSYGGGYLKYDGGSNHPYPWFAYEGYNGGNGSNGSVGANASGGAIFNSANGSITIASTTFTNNTVTGGEGGSGGNGGNGGKELLLGPVPLRLLSLIDAGDGGNGGSGSKGGDASGGAIFNGGFLTLVNQGDILFTGNTMVNGLGGTGGTGGIGGFVQTNELIIDKKGLDGTNGQSGLNGNASGNDIYNIGTVISKDDTASFAPIRTIGTVALGNWQQGYALKVGSGNPIVITYAGLNVSATSPGAGWSAIAAAASAAGYVLYFKNTNGSYAAWNLDANGGFTAGKMLSTIELLKVETNLSTDLDGDGTNGLTFAPTRTIGTVALGNWQLGYALKVGSGNPIPITYAGLNASATSPGAGWSAIAAAASATGYDLYFKNTNGSYAAWNLDANGVYTTGKLLSSVEVVVQEVTIKADLTGEGQIGPFVLRGGGSLGDALTGLSNRVTFGFAGTDTLTGGSPSNIGFDILIGGAGNDSYVLPSGRSTLIADLGGDTADSLSSMALSLNGANTKFGTLEGGRHLVISDSMSKSRAYIYDWQSNSNTIEFLHLADGTFSFQQLQQKVTSFGASVTDSNWASWDTQFGQSQLTTAGFGSSASVDNLFKLFNAVNFSNTVVKF